MKKLMIAVAIVCAAAMSQAALVSWGLSSGTVSFRGENLGNQAVKLYMVGVSGADDVLIDSRKTTNSPSSKKGQLSSNKTSAQDAWNYNSTVAGGAVWNSETGDLGRQYYIVLTKTVDNVEYTYTSSYVASSGLSDTAAGSVAFSFNDTITDVAGTKNAWVSAVPEPTSGLLLLLGVAGLALKRKRA